MGDAGQLPGLSPPKHLLTHAGSQAKGIWRQPCHRHRQGRVSPRAQPHQPHVPESLLPWGSGQTPQALGGDALDHGLLWLCSAGAKGWGPGRVSELPLRAGQGQGPLATVALASGWVLSVSGHAGSGCRAASRSLPHSPSLPVLTQQETSWPGHPASPAPAHRPPGPAAAAEPTWPRCWQRHPGSTVPPVGTASPTAPAQHPAHLSPSGASPCQRVRGCFGAQTLQAVAEPGSATVLAGRGDTCWQGHGGDSSRSPSERCPGRSPLRSGPGMHIMA